MGIAQRCCRIALLALFVTVSGISLEAQQKPASPTGLFGRLEYHSQSGDVIGLEMFIVKGRSGYFATVQIAEGVPDDPVIIPVVVEGAVISFTLRDGTNTLRYRGTVRADGLFGKFDNGAFSDRNDGFFLLKRGQSYWQR